MASPQDRASPMTGDPSAIHRHQSCHSTADYMNEPDWVGGQTAARPGCPGVSANDVEGVDGDHAPVGSLGAVV
jgi:hypothetical protein